MRFSAGPIVLTLLSVFVVARPGEAGQQHSSPPKATASPGNGLVVPAGTMIPLQLKNAINSHGAFVGEFIYCETIYPATMGDRIVIPAHSFVRGSVTEVLHPGHVRGKAQLSLRFDSITLPDGTTRPIHASVFSLAGHRLSESKAGEESAQHPEGEDMVTGGAGDAIVGASGMGGGTDPVSAVTQGVGGLVMMLATRGKSIVLLPGTTLEIQLTAPLPLGHRRASAPVLRAKDPPRSH